MFRQGPGWPFCHSCSDPGAVHGGYCRRDRVFERFLRLVDGRGSGFVSFNAELFVEQGAVQPFDNRRSGIHRPIADTNAAGGPRTDPAGTAGHAESPRHFQHRQLAAR